MRIWRWISPALVYAVHDMQIARHGGLPGVRDKNVIESALGRAKQLATYGEPQPDAAALAAAYSHGIARNHGFTDGNKRMAWIVARVFLLDNGERLTYTEADAILTMQDLAAGRISEAELAEWFRARIATD